MLHAHFGSGAEAEKWQECAEVVLNYAKDIRSVNKISLGGGFKIARTSLESSADLNEIGTYVKSSLENFAANTGRELYLEIEPGTFLMANAGALVARVEEIKSTKERSEAGGHSFVVLNCGMTELLRPSLYGAEHPIRMVSGSGKDIGEHEPLVVVGHCCESGDLFTPVSGQPELLEPRNLEKPEIGDYAVISGVGAYSSAMSCINYNSFPQAMN